MLCIVKNEIHQQMLWLTGTVSLLITTMTRPHVLLIPGLHLRPDSLKQMGLGLKASEDFKFGNIRLILGRPFCFHVTSCSRRVTLRGGSDCGYKYLYRERLTGTVGKENNRLSINNGNSTLSSAEASQNLAGAHFPNVKNLFLRTP